MAIDGRLNFDTKIDTKGFSKGINSLGNQLNNLRNIVLKMGAALGTVFSGKEALEAAADINAANSQMQQTFGTLKSAADNAMKSVADNSSILQTRLQNVGTSIYAFAKTTGMDSVSALKMMEEALQVTADSAAYYDRSLEDTAESLKSFLKGNFENDAALGLSCTETTRNTAANKLYGKSFMELSEAQKQLTLLQMVKDANALSGAEGQAAREADGWENVIGNLKESWKQLLAVIGQPVLSGAVTVVKNITAELQSLTAVANSAVKALSEVFGIKLMNTTDGVAESSSQAAENYSDMATSAEATVEAQENALASFDQINKLADNSSSSDTNASPVVGTLSGNTISTTVDVDTSDADKKLKDFFYWVKSSFNTIFTPFKQAWDKNGVKVTDSMRFAFEGVWSVIKSIGGSFTDVWSNGTGEQISEHLLGIWTNINNTIGYVSRNFSSAWSDSSGTKIIQDILDIFNDILDTIENITADTVEWAQNTCINVLKGFMAASLVTVVPQRLYSFCVNMQGTFATELLGNFISGTSDTMADTGLAVIFALASDISLFSLFFMILFGYCTVKVVFANIKRGGIMLCQIAVGSLYMFGVPRGYTDGFYSWCKQVIATCLTAFLQTTILYIGLLTYTQHPLLAVGICLSANEVPRIAQMYGLDTSVRVNMMSVSHTVSMGAKAVNMIKGKA